MVLWNIYFSELQIKFNFAYQVQRVGVVKQGNLV